MELSTNSGFKTENSHLLVWMSTLASAQAVNRELWRNAQDTTVSMGKEEDKNVPAWPARSTPCCYMDCEGRWPGEMGEKRCQDRQPLLFSFLNTLLSATTLLFNPAVVLSGSWSTSDEQFLSLDSGKAQRPQNCQEQVNNKNKIVNSSKRQKRKGTCMLCF